MEVQLRLLTSTMDGEGNQPVVPIDLPIAEENPPSTLDIRLGGPQNRSGRNMEEKIFYPFRKFNHDSSLVQLLA